MTLEETLRNSVEAMDSLIGRIEADIARFTAWRAQIIEDFNSHVAELTRGRDNHIRGIDQAIESFEHELSLLRTERK